MQTVSKYKNGVRFGLITGLAYIVLLYIRYAYFASNPRSFNFFALATYIFILLMYLITAFGRRKELGGFGTMKEIFQSIFIAILITEFFYVVFNFIYIKYADPSFVENLLSTTRSFYIKLNYTTEQIDMEMKAVKSLSDAIKPEGLLKGFGTIVIIDSIFGFLFAGILSRKKPV